MKFFETADGRLINPRLVTNCYSVTVDCRHLARFFFANDYSVDVSFESKSYSDGEIKAFEIHCAERTMRNNDGWGEGNY